MEHYNGSLISALSTAFPDIGLDISKFSTVPSNSILKKMIVIIINVKTQEIIGKKKRTEKGFLNCMPSRMDLIHCRLSNGTKSPNLPYLSKR